MTGFALTGFLILKVSSGITEEQLKASKFSNSKARITRATRRRREISCRGVGVIGGHWGTLGAYGRPQGAGRAAGAAADKNPQTNV